MLIDDGFKKLVSEGSQTERAIIMLLQILTTATFSWPNLFKRRVLAVFKCSFEI